MLSSNKKRIFSHGDDNVLRYTKYFYACCEKCYWKYLMVVFQLIFWGMYRVRSPVQGIQMFGQSQYSQAVDMFTEAIYCDPKDHRWAELWTLTPSATLWPLSSPDSINWFSLSLSHSVCLTLSLSLVSQVLWKSLLLLLVSGPVLLCPNRRPEVNSAGSRLAEGILP